MNQFLDCSEFYNQLDLEILEIFIPQNFNNIDIIDKEEEMNIKSNNSAFTPYIRRQSNESRHNLSTNYLYQNLDLPSNEKDIFSSSKKINLLEQQSFMEDDPLVLQLSIFKSNKQDNKEQVQQCNQNQEKQDLSSEDGNENTVTKSTLPSLINTPNFEEIILEHNQVNNNLTEEVKLITNNYLQLSHKSSHISNKSEYQNQKNHTTSNNNIIVMNTNDSNVDMEQFRNQFKDLNQYVDYILEISYCENKNGRDSQMRKNKNSDQVKILELEYQKNQNWTKPFMKSLAEKIGLRHSQVYKWHWDQLKRKQQK